MEDLNASLPDELGTGIIPNSDALTNGETADVASSSSTLQQMLQSNVSLSSGASSTLNSSVISTTVSVSSPNSPSLTTLTSVNSPAVNNTLSSPPQMPVSTSGTPIPATPLTSSSDLHLGSGSMSPAPSSSPLSTVNNSGNILFQNPLPQIQQDQSAYNFVGHINGTPEQPRVSLGQVSCVLFWHYLS